MAPPKGIVPGTLPAELATGDLVAGKFVVERVIGTGGMGKVLSARHRDLGTRVAIKVVHPLSLRDPDTLPRFMREARAMGRLKSEHTVRVYDVGETDDGLPFMIMEHLDGRDVSTVLRKNGPLPVEDVLQILVQASEALIEAHAAGIVHRDLKPQNLFLSRRTSGEIHVRILDFGLAKPFVGVTLGALKVTRVGDIVGTTHYMAPEQIRADGIVDGRTDVWAAGVCMFRLLTARHPFAGQSPSAVCACILTDAPLDIFAFRSDVPLAVVAIIHRCLSKAPDERYPSMRALRDALRDALAEITGRTVHAHYDPESPGLDDETTPQNRGALREQLAPDDASTNTTAHVPVVAPSLRPNRRLRIPLTFEQRLRPVHFVAAGALGMLGAFLLIVLARVRHEPEPTTATVLPPSAVATVAPPVATSAPPAPPPVPPPQPAPTPMPAIELGADPPRPAAAARRANRARSRTLD